MKYICKRTKIHVIHVKREYLLEMPFERKMKPLSTESSMLKIVCVNEIVIIGNVLVFEAMGDFLSCIFHSHLIT